MLEYFEIDGVRFHDTGKRALSRVEGLVGIAGVRDNVVARTERHGSFDRTRWQTDRLVTLEGECWGDSIADAYAEFDQLAEALYRTLEAPKLAKWRRPDARIGVTNHATNPNGEEAVKWSDFSADWAIDRVAGGALIPAFVGQYRDLHTYDGGPDMNLGSLFNIALPEPGPWVASTYIWIPTDWDGAASADGRSIRMRIDNTFAGAVGEAQVGADLALRDQWQRIYTSIDVDAGDLVGSWTLRPGIGGTGAPSSGATGYFFTDAVQIEQGLEPTDYFDGDTRGGRWTGTPHVSTSVFDGIALQALVKLAGEIAPPLEEGAKMLRYQAQVRQADPRAYIQTAREAVGAALAAAAGGLEFPFEFPILFNESSGGEATVTNNGPVETPLILRLHGFLSAPRVQLLPSGPEIKLAGDVPAGSYLEIDTAGPSIRMNGTLDRMDMLDGVNSTFFDLPTGTHQVRLFAFNSDPAAHLEVETRDAYNG